MFGGKLQWCTKYFPNDLWIIWSGSIFQAWKFPSKNVFDRELLRLIFLATLLTCFNPLFAYLLLIVKFLILGFNLFQINIFCILFNWFVMEGGVIFTRVRWVILDRPNALKTVIFSSSKFLQYTLWNTCHSEVVYCMNNEFWVF